MILLACGVLLALVVARHLSVVARQHTRVNALVAQRTAELLRANEQLQREISGRPQAQAARESSDALARMNAELSRREQITRSLLEDLETSKKELEETGRELQQLNAKLQQLAALKDEFVAKVSHELRTPLTSIKEGLGLLLDGVLGPTTADQQDFLHTMDGDIDRLTGLISDMLDIAKIEAGRMRLYRGRIEVEALIASLIRSHQPLLGQRVVTVEGTPVAPVFADRDRTIQILANFLSNALKVTDEDGAITFRVAQQNGMVAMGVHDNGPGMSAKELGKLFTKFSQVGATKAGRPRGTGLGLVVCKELTELHGGRIEVTSEEGRGSAFTVWLPVYTEAFALGEGFRELRGLLSSADAGETVCLIVMKPTPPAGAQDRELRRWLEQLASEMRQRLHRGDLVFPHEPCWAVMLALARPADLEAIIRRLQQALPMGQPLQAGVATYPDDGPDGASLFRAATARVEHPILQEGSPA